MNGTDGTDGRGDTERTDGADLTAEPPDPLAPRGTPLGGPLRAVARGAALLVMAVALTHMALLLLYVGPALSPDTARPARADAWLRPLFPQDWNIFAPDPPRANTRLEVRGWRADRPGRWIDLTAHDVAAHRGNPLPSREDQTVLRKAVSAHLAGSPHTQLRAPLTPAAQYLRNVVVVRLDDLGEPRPDTVELRLRTLPIAPPGHPAPAASRRPLGTWEVLP
ncbi:hypothetical protein GCM10010277_05070 [Streptomyces longisporoflavus]|uniref:DUF5819 family protein n=1 Tax=Streptomyces longisporoflavus TaxID=28044 RepID=UPI00167D121A|nr:DUF5819 family protein [Streptomyces longisporoflavus]GGV24661.1 hypothetical protein GCM10010277_05070 [Streptomyces longisporoflavus]